MKTFLKTGVKVLLSWRFLLNFIVILLITCWVPLLSQTMEMRDSDGNLVQQVTKVSRVYQSWWVVLRLAPGTKSHLQAVALHFGMCFFISFFVWFIRLYPRARHDTADPPDANLPAASDGETEDKNDQP